jgi:hypothetical protein
MFSGFTHVVAQRFTLSVSSFSLPKYFISAVPKVTGRHMPLILVPQEAGWENCEFETSLD